MADAYIAFYIGSPKLNKKATLNDRLITLIDGSDYSHAEFVWAYSKTGLSYCLSSSSRDGGVRAKFIDLNSGRWVLKPVSCDLDYALYVFDSFKGAGYDYLGLGSTKFAWFPNIPNRVYCSELIAAMLGFVDHAAVGVRELSVRVEAV